MSVRDDALREPTYCPYCAKLIEGAWDPAQRERAHPGALHICIGCENVALFDAGMHLRRPTMSEYTRILITHGPDIIAIRFAIREAKMLARGSRESDDRN